MTKKIGVQKSNEKKYKEIEAEKIAHCQYIRVGKKKE